MVPPMRGRATVALKVAPRGDETPGTQTQAQAPRPGSWGTHPMTDEALPKSGPPKDDPMTTHIKTYKEANPLDKILYYSIFLSP